TLLMITKDEPDEDEQAFIDFVLSEDGQKIVSDVHYIPLGNPQPLFTPPLRLQNHPALKLWSIGA
ncbi:MAG: hypothetical protein ACXQS5_07790, partial [Candidatus Methanospirareceae archaeon]